MAVGAIRQADIANVAYTNSEDFAKLTVVTHTQAHTHTNAQVCVNVVGHTFRRRSTVSTKQQAPSTSLLKPSYA